MIRGRDYNYQFTSKQKVAPNKETTIKYLNIKGLLMLQPYHFRMEQ